MSHISKCRVLRSLMPLVVLDGHIAGAGISLAVNKSVP